MSYGRKESEKDTVIFITPDDHKSLTMTDNLATDEEKKDHMGAVNEETGEINWDCPCLAGALAPPCGEYFKAAFSCFVNSKSETKEDCMEFFSAMNTCFEAHPDIYYEGLEDKRGEKAVIESDDEKKINDN